MYPKVLAAIVILLVTIRVIAGVVEKPKLAKAADVGVLLLIATSLVLWIMLGLSPVPDGVSRLIRRVVRTVAAALGG